MQKHQSIPPSFRPLYDQIKILITQSLIAGEWSPGEAIPSEIELAARYKVSQGTVRKAIDELASENIVVRRQGKGTFVATHTEERTHFRFLRVMNNEGDTPYPDSRVVEFGRGKVSAEVARLIDLRPGAPIFSIKRILSYSGKPTILDQICLPAALFKGMTQEKLSSYKGSFYSFYESQYGLRMIRAEERLSAVAADKETAAHLGIKTGTPLLCVDRIAYTYGDRPVEWRRGLCHTEGYSYHAELS
ncbi:MAG: GntR family transcriptional regulator [Burkholderiales bacterium]